MRRIFSALVSFALGLVGGYLASRAWWETA
jgi:hypothetical protein